MIYELIQSMLPYVKYTVPSVAIILAILYFWSSKWRAPYLRGGLIIVLLVAAVFSKVIWRCHNSGKRARASIYSQMEQRFRNGAAYTYKAYI